MAINKHTTLYAWSKRVVTGWVVLHEFTLISLTHSLNGFDKTTFIARNFIQKYRSTIHRNHAFKLYKVLIYHNYPNNNSTFNMHKKLELYIHATCNVIVCC